MTVEETMRDLGAEVDRLLKQRQELLASCKELRDALAAAMRTIATDDASHDELTEAFVYECARIGIKDGIGVRADAAIANAEGTK